MWKAIVQMKKLWESNLLEMFMLFQFEKSPVSGKTQVLQEMAYIDVVKLNSSVENFHEL